MKKQVRDEMDVKTILEDVKQEEIPSYSTVKTIYSAAYNLSNGNLKIWVEKDYENEHRFLLEEVKNGENCIDFGELRLKTQVSK